MSDHASARLTRLELAPLVDELARRFGDGALPVSVTMRDLPDRTRHALADLLALDRIPPRHTRVRVARLVSVLGLASVDELRDAVESLRGELPNRRADRLTDRAAREDLWAWLAAEAATVTLGPLAGWVDNVRAQGVRGGVDVHRARLENVLRVLRALPADGVPLAGFASDLLHDPHALDRGRRVSALVLDAVAVASGHPPAANAEAGRQLWESVGVAPDPLSSTVLAIGLPSDAPAPLGPWLAEAAAVGEPVVLTLAQLRRWPLAPLPREAVAYVVENPSLLAEAAARGWAGPPLVCSSGRPTVAVVTLLRQLGARGAALHQHADFDPVGVAITVWLATRAGTTPWRMTAADYIAAADRSGGVPLLGSVPDTPWDAALQRAMRDAMVAVYEESVRADLLAAMV